MTATVPVEPMDGAVVVDSPAGRRRRRRPWATLCTVGLFVFAGLFAPWITSGDPITPHLDQRLESPSLRHLLGTDDLGRDMLTRLCYGARTTLVVVAIAITLGAAIGLWLGLLAGFSGGVIDAVVSRVIDALLSIEALFFGLLFAVTLGAGLRSVVLAIALVLWSRFARVIRSEVLQLREADFVSQARVIGCSRRRILAVHLLPNVLTTTVVLVSIYLGQVVLLEATLSFLGAGIPAPTPSWGGMISDGQRYLTSAWWVALMPGFVILLLVLAFNLLGDWVRDRLDPNLDDE